MRLRNVMRLTQVPSRAWTTERVTVLANMLEPGIVSVDTYIHDDDEDTLKFSLDELQALGEEFIKAAKAFAMAERLTS